MVSLDSAKQYRPGELAPVTGVYEVVHLTGHREPHQVILIRGEEIPICRQCKGEVEFRIVHQASHATHDWDFAGPSGTLLVKRPA